MATLSQGQLPIAFQHSYLSFPSYPCNLGHASRLATASLKAFKSRLDSMSHDLFETDESRVEIPCQDLHLASGKEFDRRYIHTFGKLTGWLGIETEYQANTGKRIVKAKHADPKCRVIDAPFLDMMSVFGEQLERRDLVQFGSFRQQMTIHNRSQGPGIDALGRSGSNFQLSYLLASVTFKGEDPQDFRLNDWSIRQAAIHHQFDVENGKTLWIVTKGRIGLWYDVKDLMDARPERSTFDTVGGCMQFSLTTHMLFCQWSADDWRGYVRWLERKVDAESSMTVLGPSGGNYSHKQYKSQDIQDLQRLEDKANEITTTLEANGSVLKALQRFYESLNNNQNFSERHQCAGHIAQFTVDLDDIINDFEMQRSRTKALAKLISDRKVMAVQHMQSQAAERVQTLNQHMEKEAIVMRIITVVTLFYLPPTFVSTFFSAGVVQYQDQNGNDINGGSFSRVGMSRWLEVALPLTFLTVLAAFMGKRWAESSRQRIYRFKEPLMEKSTPIALANLNANAILPTHNGQLP